MLMAGCVDAARIHLALWPDARPGKGAARNGAGMPGPAAPYARPSQPDRPSTPPAIPSEAGPLLNDASPNPCRGRGTGPERRTALPVDGDEALPPPAGRQRPPELYDPIGRKEPYEAGQARQHPRARPRADRVEALAARRAGAALEAIRQRRHRASWPRAAAPAATRLCMPPPCIPGACSVPCRACRSSAHPGRAALSRSAGSRLAASAPLFAVRRRRTALAIGRRSPDLRGARAGAGSPARAANLAPAPGCLRGDRPRAFGRRDAAAQGPVRPPPAPLPPPGLPVRDRRSPAGRCIPRGLLPPPAADRLAPLPLSARILAQKPAGLLLLRARPLYTYCNHIIGP